MSEPNASTVVEVPDDLDELLTPVWLTAALSSRFPGVQVVAVTRGPVVERLSTNVRFRIECSPEVPPGLSPTLCVKGWVLLRTRPLDEERRRTGGELLP